MTFDMHLAFGTTFLIAYCAFPTLHVPGTFHVWHGNKNNGTVGWEQHKKHGWFFSVIYSSLPGSLSHLNVRACSCPANTSPLLSSTFYLPPPYCCPTLSVWNSGKEYLLSSLYLPDISHHSLCPSIHACHRFSPSSCVRGSC